MIISNIITQLQNRAQESNDPLVLATLAKVIEKLELGKIEVVETTNSLPTLPLDSNGELYLIESDEELYFNSNNDWLIFPILPVNLNILYAWGRNSYGGYYGSSYYGCLGTGDTINRSSPVTVVGGITSWSQIAGGFSHSLGLTDTGVLYAWGDGGNGRLGTNNGISQSSPVTVAGGITSWSGVAAGGSHSLGLTDTGVLYAWGSGSFGRLGTGNTINRSSPVTVAGGITNWSQIAGGDIHSLGLTDTGVLYAWGIGSFGRLGTGNITNRSSPVTVAGGITNWSQIAGGFSHSLGLTDTGVLYAWGMGSFGRLGTGDTINRSSPTTVAGGITNWSQIAGGDIHSLGLTDTGVLYAWGSGGDGQLGTNNATTQSSPVTVVGGITNWSDIVAADSCSLGLTDTGVLYAWGSGGDGRLGTGDTTSQSSPVTVAGGITNWSGVAALGSHSLAFANLTRETLVTKSL